MHHFGYSFYGNLTADQVRMAQMHHQAKNFIKIGQTVVEIAWFLDQFNMATVRHLEFRILQILMAGQVRMSRCITLPTLVRIYKQLR